MTTKTCERCGGKYETTRPWIARWCLACQPEARREGKSQATLRWQRANPERTNAAHRGWRLANPDKVKASLDRYRRIPCVSCGKITVAGNVLRKGERENYRCQSCAVTERRKAWPVLKCDWCGQDFQRMPSRSGEALYRQCPNCCGPNLENVGKALGRTRERARQLIAAWQKVEPALTKKEIAERLVRGERKPRKERPLGLHARYTLLEHEIALLRAQLESPAVTP